MATVTKTTNKIKVNLDFLPLRLQKTFQARVKERKLSQFLQKRLGAGTEIRPVCTQDGHSPLFLAQNADSKFFIKICSHKKTLFALYPHLSNAIGYTIRRWRFSTLLDVVISPYFEGTSLREALPRLSADERENIGKRLGERLRTLHKTPCQNAKKRKHATTLSSAVKKQLKKTPCPALSALLLEEEIKGKETCLLHGDFSLANVIYQDNGECVPVDFENMRLGNPYDDLALFQLDCKQFSDLFSAFLSAYFEGEIPTHADELLAQARKEYVFRLFLDARTRENAIAIANYLQKNV